MRLGAENRTKLIAAVALGALALALAAMRFGKLISSGSTSPTPVAANVDSSFETPASARPAPTRTRTATKKPASTSLDPTLHYDLLKASEDTKYTGTGRNIFMMHVEIPKPIVTPVVQQQEAQGPPPPPPPPPIELKYYGFANVADKPGEPRSIFLAHGEDVFIAKEGDIVNRRYKIVRATQNSVEILDVLSNNRQRIPLTQG